MLPVIPGPCGLYRYSAIRDQAIPFYIKTVGSHPAECGILMANLNLAEDRVLSYAAVVRTHERAYTAYVPEATFYFEAETKPLMLFTQRRRWINGTIAGYIWLLSNPGIIWWSNVRCWNKPMLTLLLICQVFMYMAVAISPAIFAVSVRWTLPWAQTYFLGSYGDDDSWLKTSSVGNIINVHDLILIIYGIIYVIFVFVHSRPSLKPAVLGWLVHLIGFVNAIFMIIMFAAMAVALYDNYLQHGFAMGPNAVQNWITVLVLCNIFGPMVLALFHSPYSFFCMLKSFIQFYLLLPTMVTLIGAYALSRVWDLSWGNRPSEGSSLATKKSAEELKRNGDIIRMKGQFIALIVMVANLLFVAIVLGEGRQSDTVVALALFIFAWTAIQMAFSFLYFVFRHVRRFKRSLCHCLCVTCCRCKTEKQWYARNEKARRLAKHGTSS